MGTGRGMMPRALVTLLAAMAMAIGLMAGGAATAFGEGDATPTVTATGKWAGADYTVFSDGTAMVTGRFTEAVPGQAPADLRGCTAIDCNSVDTSGVVRFSDMFSGCRNLRTADGVRSWDLTHGNSISAMFNGDTSLTDISGLSAWDTSGIAEMPWIFQGCTSLASLAGLEGWDTSNVYEMSGAFNGIPITNVDALSKWDVSGVSDARFLFQDDRQLADMSGIASWRPVSLNLANYAFMGLPVTNLDFMREWRTPNLGEAVGMFQSDTKLADLSGIEGWDTSGVYTMNNMFHDCEALRNVDALSKWDTSNVGDMAETFRDCYSLADLSGLASWDVSNVTTMHGMFRTCHSLSDLSGLSAWKTPKLTDIAEMFMGCDSGLRSLAGLEGLDVSHVTTMESTFDSCHVLASLEPLASWDTTNVRNMSHLLFEAYGLPSLEGLEGWDVGRVTDLSYAFSEATGMHGDDAMDALSAWRTTSLENASGAFMKDYQITTLRALEGWDMSHVTDAGSMFDTDPSLTDVSAVNSWSLPSLRTAAWMFQGCRFAKADIASWRLDDCNVSDLFANNPDLAEVDMGSTAMTNVPGFGDSGPFSGDPKLARVDISDGIPASVVGSLPTPPANADYTGRWVREDETYGPYTVSDLASAWQPAAMSGVWVWEKVPTTYRVSFDANGGEGSMSAVTLTPGDVAATLPASTFENFRHTFKEWNTKADGTGHAYTPGMSAQTVWDESTGGPAVAGAKLTLYAIWEPERNVVDIEGGEFDVDLADGETMTLDGLPAGTSYVIYEETPSGWRQVGGTATSGVIQPSRTAAASVTNRYEPGSVSATITGTKTLDGQGASGFSFTLSEGGSDLETVASAEGGGIAFSPITYTSAGTHTYTVREVAGDDDGISYDTHAETVTVDVADDGAGNLSAKVGTDADGVSFANRTKPGSLAITKRVTGTDDTGREFTAHVELTDGTSRDVTLKAGETQEIDGLAAGVGYTVTESDVPAGYTLSGIAGATGTIGAGRTSPVTITNAYAATGSVTLQATKRLSGGTLVGGEFAFGLFEGDTQLATATNAADGAVTFDPVSYASAGAHGYTIRELTGTTGDVASDGHVATAHVDVTDDGDGHLSCAVTYGTGDEAPTFSNTVTPGALVVTKRWSGEPAGATHQVTLDVTLADGDGAPLSGPITAVIHRTADGTSEARTYEATDGRAKVNEVLGDGGSVALALPRDTSYTLSEEAADGYSARYEVGGKASDTGVSGTVGRASDITVTNTYRATGSWTPEATKALVGPRALRAGEFTFRLIDASGNVVSQATNDADGKVGFPAIPLDGTERDKTYYLSETMGTDDHVTYDLAVFEVKVSAADDGRGHVVPTVTYAGRSEVPTITNRVSADVGVPMTGGSGVTWAAVAGLASVAAVAALALWRARGGD